VNTHNSRTTISGQTTTNEGKVQSQASEMLTRLQSPHDVYKRAKYAITDRCFQIRLLLESRVEAHRPP
jgi:hypothetical protein